MASNRGVVYLGPGKVEVQSIDWIRGHVEAVNATVITLDRAPEGYQQFDTGVAKKFVLDPHGALEAA